MDLSLSDEQVTLRNTVAQLAKDVYAPKALEWDARQEPLPDSEKRRLGDMGLLGICLSKSCGGSEGALLDAIIAIEELGKECMPAAFQVFEANTGAARVIDLFGTEEQRLRLLPAVVSGNATIALAISEPEIGSAATDLATRGVVGDEVVVVNGTKQWCSGGGHAEQYLVYVRVSDAPGSSAIGAVVVDADAPGISYGRRESYMGLRSIPSAQIVLHDVRVPRHNLIVGAGHFRDLFSAFSIERLGNATMSLAIAQSCLERTTRYVLERQQFGKTIVNFQLVQAALADMIMDVEASRLLIYSAASAGRETPTALASSIAKCFANEAAKRTSDAALLLHGAYGYSTESGIERFHRDAHGWAIAGGTPTMQRLRIASEFVGMRFDQRG